MDSASTANDKYDPSTTAEDPFMRQITIGGEGTYITAMGWECPRCKSINNPSLQQCLCSKTPGVVMSGPTNINIDWNGLMGPWVEAIRDA